MNPVMEITYLGHASFKLKGKTATVVIDPFDASIVGISFPKVAAEVVISSHNHPDHAAVERVSGTTTRPHPMVINAPGEYEVQGVSIFGYKTFHDNKEGVERGKNMISVVHMDEVVAAHLGDLGHTLNDKILEEVGEVDVLFVPVGGFYTIGPEQALEVIEQLEPSLVIPMHFRAPGMGSSFDKLATIEEFLKLAGAENARRETKLTVTQQSLPEDREVVVLERS